MFAQRLGFAIAGFYAGGYLGVAAAQSITLPSDPMVWFVIGGVIGALVAFMMMDWAIVVLSSFVGAGTITAALGPDSTTSAILFIVLAAIGVIFQGRRLQGQAPAPPDQANSAAP
jgi:peptidoglycan/LPS O-acetylase OafA/YrhL